MEFKLPAVFTWIVVVAIVAGPFGWKVVAQTDGESTNKRSFVIDYENDQFVKDGQPFRYVSGSLHYFRVPSVHWQDRLDKFKAAGLNAVQTYVEWSSHEPESEQYYFEGGLDLIQFLKMANDTGLLVILRPGPYICAERDMGGLPYWLLHEDPNMRLRSSDSSFLKYVDRWWTKLFNVLTPDMFYANGGPIISIQVENEYGTYYTRDFNYTEHLRDLLRQSLGDDVLLFTTDSAAENIVRYGKIQDVYATIDFGNWADVDEAFQVQRAFEPRGPLVNSEYYTGWLDLWGSPHTQVNVSKVANTLDLLLVNNASFNMYVFHGGSNFGFTSGSISINNSLLAMPTSYDYDAPLSEAGDPTEMYTAIRNVIAKYKDVPSDPVPPATPKKAYGLVHLRPIHSLFDSSIHHGEPRHVDYPITFEAFGQAFGFVLYSTVIDGVGATMTKGLLQVVGLHDRGYVFVDKKPCPIVLSRMDDVYAQNITVRDSQQLHILVENQGRISFAPFGLTDFKGIVSNVTLDGRILSGWTLTSIPLNETSTLSLDATCFNTHGSVDFWNNLVYIPTLFIGDFILPEEELQPEDTFLDPTGWQKGVAFVNGFNVGRYWPVEGPQVTLYVPKNLLRPAPQVNRLLVFELESPPPHRTSQSLSMSFTDVPILNGTVPVGATTVLSKFLNFAKSFQIQVNSS